MQFPRKVRSSPNCLMSLFRSIAMSEGLTVFCKIFFTFNLRAVPHRRQALRIGGYDWPWQGVRYPIAGSCNGGSPRWRGKLHGSSSRGRRLELRPPPPPASGPTILPLPVSTSGSRRMRAADPDEWEISRQSAGATRVVDGLLAS